MLGKIEETNASDTFKVRQRNETDNLGTVSRNHPPGLRGREMEYKARRRTQRSKISCGRCNRKRPIISISRGDRIASLDNLSLFLSLVGCVIWVNERETIVRFRNFVANSIFVSGLPVDESNLTRGDHRFNEKSGNIGRSRRSGASSNAVKKEEQRLRILLLDLEFCLGICDNSA